MRARFSVVGAAGSCETVDPRSRAGSVKGLSNPRDGFFIADESGFYREAQVVDRDILSVSLCQMFDFDQSKILLLGLIVFSISHDRNAGLHIP